MTRKLFHYGLVIVVLVTATAAFSVMRSLNQRRQAHGDGTSEWLSLSGTQSRQINQADPDFKEQAQVLSEQLQAHQQGLINLIRVADSTDESVRMQAILVVDAHHRLMRRVVQRLLAVRRYTDTQQGARLRGLCSGVMGCGPQGGPGMHGPGHGPGRGMGMGMGPGMGRGMGMRMGMGQQRCGRMAPALALTPAQEEKIVQLDPSFETDVPPLTEKVRMLHGQFAQNLADSEVSDAVIQSSLDDLIRARVLLEQRTTEHVVRIRPLLSVEQQQRLIGLSQMGCGGRGSAGL
jgi:hypothetical protein